MSDMRNPFDDDGKPEAHPVEMGLSVMEAETRGQIDIQISTARAYPRSLTEFYKEARFLATMDADIAAGCYYSVPRGGKVIEGPSARLAEIVLSAYQHMRVQSRPVDDDGRFITCRGTAWDMQKNVAIEADVKRRITDKDGKRFTDDMIVVTTNACSSIARRNAIFGIIPNIFTKRLFQECKQVAAGKADTLVERRDNAMKTVVALGAARERVFAALGVKGIEDIGLDLLAVLKGFITAISEGDTTVAEAFPPIASESSSTGVGATQKLKDKLQDQRAAKKQDQRAAKKQAQQTKPDAPAEPAKSEPTKAEPINVSRATAEQLAEVVALCKKANSSVDDAVKCFVGEVDGELTHAQAAQLIAELKDSIGPDNLQETAETLELK